MAAAHLSLPAIDESEIYRHLELDWVPPELREDTGEIAAAQDESLPLSSFHPMLKEHYTITPHYPTVMQHSSRWRMRA